MPMQTRPAPRVLFAEPVIIELLTAAGLVDGVSTRNGGAERGKSHARVTIIGDATPTDPWATISAQVEVWHHDVGTAGDIASGLATYWNTLVSGTAGDARVNGCWIVQRPRSFPDPDTDAHRFILTVGLNITPQEA